MVIVFPAETIVLQKTIAAIQVVAGENGEPGMGSCLHIPKGSSIEICGAGFSDGTVQVRSQGACYFVLRQSVST